MLRLCCRLLFVLLSLLLLLFSSVSALAAEVYSFSEPVSVVSGFSPELDSDSFYAAVGVDVSDEEAVQRFVSFLSALNVDSLKDFSVYYKALGYADDGLDLAWAAYLAFHDDLDSSTLSKTPIYDSSGKLVGYRYTGDNIALEVGQGHMYLGYLDPPSNILNGAIDLNDLRGLSTDLSEMTKILQSIRDIIGSAGLGTTVLSEIVAIYSLLASNFSRVITIPTHVFNPASSDISYWETSSVYNNFSQVIGQLFGQLMYSNSMNTKSLYEVFTHMPFSFQWVGLDDVNHVGDPVTINGNGLFDYLGQMMFYSTVSSSYNLLRVSQNVREVVTGDTSHVLTTYEYDEQGQLQETQHSANNLIETMVAGFESIGSDIAKLQFVLADDASIETKVQEIPNQEAFKDNFLGDGSGAANPQDIKDAAQISSFTAGLFKTDVSLSDFYGVLNDESLFSFFTQETAGNLDAVGSPVPASEEFDILSILDQFDFDENGVAIPKNPADFDLSAYLAQKGG